ncbi:MAG: hypothetical protein GC152_08340 [Alphaproteobacteria bacterium]|nr:hypothetical protein [Alphaproteobacteria bacterium]
MEPVVRIAWLSIALVHAAPAAVAFAPGLVERLYGVQPTGETGILLIHRGMLFLAVFLASVLACIDYSGRRIASMVVSVSVIGFLLVYVRAGMPSGPLKSIAIADLIALAPLCVILFDAWISE